MRISTVSTFLLMLAATGMNAHASLVGYWAFDETGGSTANASAGGINGLLNGGAVFAPGAGVAGGAISLDKTLNTWVNMGLNFDFTADYSVQAWVKLTGTDAENPLAKHYAGIAQGYFLGINDVGDGCSAGGKVHFYSGYPCSPNSTTTVNDGQWHQLVGVSQGGFLSIYVDGQLQGTNSGGSVNSSQTAAPFMVGGINSSSGLVSTYTGLVDEVKVWDSALTSREVLSEFENTAPEPGSILLLVSGAVGLYRFRRRLR